MFNKILVPAIFAVSFAGAAQAQDNASIFAEADALFAKRGDAVAADQTDKAAVEAARKENLATTEAAQAAYQAIIDGGLASDADLLKAKEGVLRAIVFRGNALTPKDTDANKKIREETFKECNKVADSIKETASPAYFYFKAACIAYEAEVSNPLERLVLLPQLLGTLKAGLDADATSSYEFGGLWRVNAAVKGNVEAKGLPGGLFNPLESLVLINKAIESGDFDGWKFCDNHLRKLITLQTLEKEGVELPSSEVSAAEFKAKTLADFQGYIADGIFTPAEGEQTILPETNYCLSQIEAL